MNRELLLVGAGLLLMIIHSIDESMAFGAPSGPPWIAQIAIILLVLVVCAVHPRLGSWRVMPAAVVFGLGVFAVRTAWQAHVQPLLERGPGATDGTGVLFLCGGLVLIGAGVLLVVRTLHTGAPGVAGQSAREASPISR